jgi:hypothetical protein
MHGSTERRSAPPLAGQDREGTDSLNCNSRCAGYSRFHHALVLRAICLDSDSFIRQ